jgi:broad specificity phosphatase PhoE
MRALRYSAAPSSWTTWITESLGRPTSRTPARFRSINVELAPTRVFLIRHADVENPRRLLYGHLDGFQLSALGRAQALAVGDRLASAGLKRIVHSPLARAHETAELINSRLAAPAILEADPELREAEFSRYLQGLPYWQIPVRRPLWFVHKAKRGLLPGDEAINKLGGRVLDVMKRIAREHPGETMAIVSHADPLQAAWILLDGRAHNERELYRKVVDRAGVLQVDLEGDKPVAWEYIAPPKVASPASAVPS